MRYNLLAFVLMLLLFATTANALLITPLDDIDLTVDEGQFANIVFTFFNNENISINISINTTPSLEDIIFLSDDNFTTPMNSTINISCIIRRDSPVVGKIYFNYNSTITEVNVTIEESEMPGGNITIIPAQPTSESNIVFILPDREDATGYMICRETNKVYFIEVADGIGFVELGDDYGDAYVAIFTRDKKYVAEFVIDVYFKEEITINMPSTTVVNEPTAFQVFASGTPIQAEMQFKLGETIISKTTDATGIVSIQFSKVGNWTVTAKVFNVEKIQNIYVAQKPIVITLPEDIYVDQEIQIVIGTKSDVLISINELSWSYTTDDAGVLSFTPSFPGKHSIHVIAHDFQEGSKDFIVYADIIIEVKDENKIVTSIKPHTLYAIYVIDENNKPIASKLEIYGDGVLVDEMDIAGSAIWSSNELCVTYEFIASPSEIGYVEDILTLYGKEETMDMNIMISGITTVIAIAILICIYIFKREWFSSAREKGGKWLQSKRNPIAPL